MGNTAGKDAKQVKYVLAAEDVETQMRWEELIREQIWNASTTTEVRPPAPVPQDSPAKVCLSPQPRTQPSSQLGQINVPQVIIRDSTSKGTAAWRACLRPSWCPAY